MAVNEITIDAPREAVFAVLADPGDYAHWVVGASEIHSADSTWPAPGASFHHSQGIPPLRLHDTTTVLECEPAERLVLEARLRPLAVQRVDLRLRSEGAATHVTMVEKVVPGGLGLLVRNPLVDRLIKARNVEALRRLKRIAERDQAAAQRLAGTSTGASPG